MTQQLGQAEVDITPDFQVELGGFAARVQPCIGVGDPIYARALYLEEEEERLLWIHADLLAFSNELASDLKARLGRRLGLEPRQIVLSATHTHSAPAVLPLICAGENEARYVEWLRPRIERAAMEAAAKTEPVEPCLGEGECPLAHDRRGKPSAHVDSRIAVIGWKRENGTWAALLANYAIHHVAYSWENRRISADMAGMAAADLEGSLPGKPLVLLTTGAAANLNPPFLSTDEGQVRGWAEQIAAAVGRAISAAEPMTGTRIRSAARITAIQLESVDESRRTVEAYMKHVGSRSRNLAAIGDTGDSEFLLHQLRSAGERWLDTMARHERAGSAPATLPLNIQVVALGDVLLPCFAGEIFSVMADELRAAAGMDRLSIVGFANGYCGYICPGIVYDEGGYEPDMAFIFGGIPRPRRGAHEAARAGALDLLRSLAPTDGR